MVEYKSSLDLAFGALADPSRRKIVKALLNEGALRVSDLAEPFDMSFAGVSKHIKVLEQANLVKRARKGREVLVQLNPKPLIEVQDWLKFHEKFWKESFENLDQLIKDELS